tara:strand:- start:1370 stop:2176 length:807 start_codon:yes stop_codon:yes gene_type:complete
MIKEEIKIFFTSIMFYTRIPCPSYIDHSDEYLNKASRYFPLVGIIVGAISFILFWISNQIFNIHISIVISIAAGILITGAFHEDGLADTFDGFGGGWTREKILEIMKDSRIGTYGTISLLVLVILKIFTFSSLVMEIQSNFTNNSDLIILLIFITYHSISRLTAISIVFTSDYSRDNEIGKSKPVAKTNTKIEILIAYFWGILPLLGLIYLIPEFILVISLLIFFFFYSSRYFKKHIGGYTGDTLGAVEQLSEIICLLTFLGLTIFFI